MTSISLSLAIYNLALHSYYPAEIVMIKMLCTLYSLPHLHVFSSSTLYFSLHRCPRWSGTRCSLLHHFHVILFFSPSLMYLSSSNLAAVRFDLVPSVSAAQVWTAASSHPKLVGSCFVKVCHKSLGPTWFHAAADMEGFSILASYNRQITWRPWYIKLLWGGKRWVLASLQPR